MRKILMTTVSVLALTIGGAAAMAQTGGTGDTGNGSAAGVNAGTGEGGTSNGVAAGVNGDTNGTTGTGGASSGVTTGTDTTGNANSALGTNGTASGTAGTVGSNGTATGTNGTANATSGASSVNNDVGSDSNNNASMPTNLADVPTNELRNADVVDSSGTQIGQVSDLELDGNNQVTRVLVDVNDGSGTSKTVALDPSQVTIEQSAGTIVLMSSLSEDELQNMSPYQATSGTHLQSSG